MNGVGGSLTNGISAVTIDLSVLGGAQFSDQLTLLGPVVPRGVVALRLILGAYSPPSMAAMVPPSPVGFSIAMELSER